MSVYYYKGAKILAPFTIVSNEPMFDVDTVSLKKQRATQSAQRWEISFATLGEPDTQLDMFLGSIVDVQDVDTMVMPQLPQADALKTASSETINVTAGAAVDATTVSLQNAGFSGIIPKGTFFKFSNHGKMYLTTSEVNLDDASPSVDFYPKLRVAVTTAHTLNIGSQAVLSFYRDINNIQGITFQDGVLSDTGNVTLIEAI